MAIEDSLEKYRDYLGLLVPCKRVSSSQALANTFEHKADIVM